MSIIESIRRRFWLLRLWHLRMAYGFETDGERVCPEYPDTNFQNHLNFYRFAGQFANGRIALDVGCGTGYGSVFLLAKGARRVTGIDYSQKAIAYCRRRYGRTALDFQEMDAHDLAFNDQSFDLVTSSENLEHLQRPDRCLAEVRRVLRRGGSLVLGTPNREMFAPERELPDNPYHVQEFSFGALHALLRAHFDSVHVFENTEPSPSELGRRLRAERELRGEVGLVKGTLTHISLHGLEVDLTELRNTHGFIALCN